MDLSQFDFDLPEKLIAKRPCSPRNESRLLIGSNPINHDSFLNITNYINDNDLIVINNSKVIPIYLSGKVLSHQIKVTLHKSLGNREWLAYLKPGKKVNYGDIILFPQDHKAEVLKKEENGEFRIKFHSDENNLINLQGKMPLPPYILKKRDSDEKDFVDYQTVYAKEKGSIAAPTAGLHFNEKIFQMLKDNGQVAEVTLHVGAGTFQPIRSSIDDHVMHSEKGYVPLETIEKIEKTKKKKGRIIAVGTTTLRLLESAALSNGILKYYNDDTNIFIKPGFRFNVVDVLLTNFHLPQSTLMLLVSAFSGIEKIKEIYQIALKKEYRFFSYGDVSLLYRDEQF